MELGRLDVCLRVADVATSRQFYEQLDFHRVEGGDDEGWAVMVQGDARIGLFETQFMKNDCVSLNFRGANIPQLVSELSAKQISFVGEPKLLDANGGSFSVRDPDGFQIFFDSHDEKL